MTLVIGSRTPTLGDVSTDTWPSTGAIETETASLEISVQQLGRDIFNDSTVSAASDDYQALQNAWNSFVADFDQWRDAAWFWNPSRRDELIGYRARFNALLAQWRGLGVVTAAAPVVGDKPATSPLDQVLGILDKVVLVVGIGAAVWAASTIYKELRPRGPGG